MRESKYGPETVGAVVLVVALVSLAVLVIRALNHPF